MISGGVFSVPNCSKNLSTICSGIFAIFGFSVLLMRHRIAPSWGECPAPPKSPFVPRERRARGNASHQYYSATWGPRQRLPQGQMEFSVIYLFDKQYTDPPGTREFWLENRFISDRIHGEDENKSVPSCC